MLTTSELKQVKHYLELYSKKDSQLPPADIPLDKYDQVAIVQRGSNRLVPITELQETIGVELKKDVCTYNWYISHPEEIDNNTIYVCTTDDGSQVIQIYLQGYPFMSTSDAEFSFTTTKSAVFTDSGSSTTVGLNATASPVASDITFYYKDGDIYVKIGDTFHDKTAASGEKAINDTTKFKAIAHILGKEIEIERVVTGVQHVYWGAGSSTSVSSASLTTETAHNVPFNITVNIVTTSGQYLYFEAPSGWTVDKVEIVGTVTTTLGVTPITASHTSYNAFRSTNAREASGNSGYNYRIYFKQQ